jgi:hypothetical protein
MDGRMDAWMAEEERVYAYWITPFVCLPLSFSVVSHVLTRGSFCAVGGP